MTFKLVSTVFVSSGHPLESFKTEIIICFFFLFSAIRRFVQIKRDLEAEEARKHALAINFNRVRLCNVAFANWKVSFHSYYSAPNDLSEIITPILVAETFHLSATILGSFCFSICTKSV